MNCTLSPILDHSSSKSTSKSNAATQLQLFLNTNGIADVWRFRNPTARSYSFFSPVHGTYSRIDYFFIDKSLLSLITECEYRPIIISDHAPLLMTLCIPISQANYHPWRLNTLLLADENFNKFISSEITSFLEINQTPGMSPLTVWESMKAYLRGQIISYSAQQRKLHNMKLEQLANDILKLDSILATAPSNDLFKQRMTLQTDFNLLSTRQIENLINKTQSKIYECGEKTGKILAHQLSQKTADRTIAEIKDESGIKHIDHSEINSCFHKFYTKLYDSESLGDHTLFDSFFFRKIKVPKIDTKTASELDQPFSVEELTNAIKLMQTGKSPGPDGFPSEFFEICRPTFSHPAFCL